MPHSVGGSYGPGEVFGGFLFERGRGTKDMEEITREEAKKACKEIAACLREGVLTEMQVLHARLFETAAEDRELFTLWVMGGGALKYITQHLTDTISDIEIGGYLPKPIEGTE